MRNRYSGSRQTFYLVTPEPQILSRDCHILDTLPREVRTLDTRIRDQREAAGNRIHKILVISLQSEWNHKTNRREMTKFSGPDCLSTPLITL